MYFPLNFCENFKNSFAEKYLRATDSKLIPFLKKKNKKKTNGAYHCRAVACVLTPLEPRFVENTGPEIQLFH